MKINHAHHIAVNAKDIDESVAFYTDILGLRETSRADMGDLTLVYMQIEGNSFIELFDLRGRAIDGKSPEDQTGLRHIAFDVDNVREWDAFLREKGIEFTQELTEMPPIGKRAILFYDPNGVIIELCENL